MTGRVTLPNQALATDFLRTLPYLVMRHHTKKILLRVLLSIPAVFQPKLGSNSSFAVSINQCLLIHQALVARVTAHLFSPKKHIVLVSFTNRLVSLTMLMVAHYRPMIFFALNSRSQPVSCHRSLWRKLFR